MSWLRTLAAIGCGISSAITLYLAGAIGDKDTGPATRDRLRNIFGPESLFAKYTRLIEGLERVLTRIYGEPQSLRAFSVCLVIAVAYPFLSFVVGYAFGGPSELAGLPALPPDAQFRWAWPASLCASLALLLVLIVYQRRIGNSRRLRGRNARTPALMRVTLAISTALGSAAVLAVEAHLLGTPFTRTALAANAVLFVLLAFASALVAHFAGAGAATIATTAILAAIFGLPFAAVPGACTFNAVSGALFVVAFGFALGGIAAGSTSYVCAYAYAYSFAVTGTAVRAGVGEPINDGVRILLFVGGLPGLNALFDWVSWRVSRYFISKAIRAGNWRIPARDIVIDAVLAFGFMVGLVMVLPGLFEILPPLLDSLSTLDWKSNALAARDAPWTKGAMVTLMVITTLVPTAIHVAAGTVAVFAHLLRGHKLAPYLSSMDDPNSKHHGNKIDPLFAAAWIVAYFVGAAALVVGICAAFLWVIDLPIATWLYDLAVNHSSPWWLLLAPALLMLGRYSRNKRSPLRL